MNKAETEYELKSSIWHAICNVNVIKELLPEADIKTQEKLTQMTEELNELYDYNSKEQVQTNK